MRTDFSALVLAMAATGALAAPIGVCSAPKKTFSVPISPKQARPMDPIKEMQHAANKYGVEVPFLDPLTSVIGYAVSTFLPSAIAAIPSVHISVPGYNVIAPPGYGASNKADSLTATATASATASVSAPVTASGFSGTASMTGTASASVSTSGPVGATTSDASVSGVQSTATLSQSTESVTSSSSTSTSSSSTSILTSTSSTNSGSSGEVTATPEVNDSSYLAPVTIGGQSVTLNFDTGSADLWVFSSKLSADSVSGHSVFDPSKSSTWADLSGASWSIRYGDGSGASGSVGFDHVEVGGITVQKQAVELAEQVSSSFVEDVNSDGLLGLGFSSINRVTPERQKTWFENVKGQLRSPIFTADLDADTSGTYEFGSINPAKYTGEITYTTIDKSQGFWQFQSPFTRVNGATQNCQTCSPTIADTGTSLLLMDNEVVTNYYASVSGAELDNSYGGYVYPCTSTLPEFSIAIGNDFVATIPSASMQYAKLNENLCFGSLQSSAGSGKQILGAVFFKQYFSIFDGTDGAERLGLAAKSP